MNMNESEMSVRIHTKSDPEIAKSNAVAENSMHGAKKKDINGVRIFFSKRQIFVRGYVPPFLPLEEDRSSICTKIFRKKKNVNWPSKNCQKISMCKSTYIHINILESVYRTTLDGQTDRER